MIKKIFTKINQSQVNVDGLYILQTTRSYALYIPQTTCIYALNILQTTGTYILNKKVKEIMFEGL